MFTGHFIGAVVLDQLLNLEFHVTI